MKNNNVYIHLVALDITYHCPLRCLHCFNSSGEKHIDKEELSDEEILNLIDEMLDLDVATVSLGGGEALVRNNLLYAIGDKINVSHKRLTPAIVSNGYLLTEEVASQLKKANLTNVQISIDGLKENHDKMRNCGGSFEKAINAIKYMQKENMKVAVAFSPTKFNIGDIEPLFNYLKSIGVSMFRTQPLMLLGRAEKNLKSELLSYKEYRVLQQFIDCKKKENPKMLIEWGDPLDHLVRGSINSDKIAFLSIGAYGDIFVSPYLPLVVGNIRKHSFKEYIDNGLPEIWNNPFLQWLGERVTDVTNMDLKKYGLPQIFTEEPIELDILDKDYKLRTREFVERYCNFKK